MMTTDEQKRKSSKFATQLFKRIEVLRSIFISCHSHDGLKQKATPCHKREGKAESKAAKRIVNSIIVERRSVIDYLTFTDNKTKKRKQKGKNLLVCVLVGSEAVPS